LKQSLLGTFKKPYKDNIGFFLIIQIIST